ncbi:hypothetical protein BFG57_03510 [Bacillus solimangrovi]|uniref:RDD domain-containing protein n=2 Tax=Bacillus solimangrovi TaxID=1305675 RepID=A0A1E5LCV9_9BACI|nr:hypothetical protein BFG57_03510 [Bacillus solimangrovi]
MNEQQAPVTEDLKNMRNIWYAGFWIRLLAYGIDLIVISSIHRLIVYPIFKLGGWSVEEVSDFSVIAIVTAIVGYTYLVLMTKWYQQTLGKMIVGLKVIDKDGNSPSWLTVIFREVVGKFISKTVWFIGFIWIAFSGKKQGWHDKIADTFVIHERK